MLLSYRFPCTNFITSVVFLLLLCIALFQFLGRERGIYLFYFLQLSYANLCPAVNFRVHSVLRKTSLGATPAPAIQVSLHFLYYIILFYSSNVKLFSKSLRVFLTILKLKCFVMFAKETCLLESRLHMAEWFSYLTSMLAFYKSEVREVGHCKEVRLNYLRISTSSSRLKASLPDDLDC